jgi:hypothetical protein
VQVSLEGGQHHSKGDEAHGGGLGTLTDPSVRNDGRCGDEVPSSLISCRPPSTESLLELQPFALSRTRRAGSGRHWTLKTAFCPGPSFATGQYEARPKLRIGLLKRLSNWQRLHEALLPSCGDAEEEGVVVGNHKTARWTGGGMKISVSHLLTFTSACTVKNGVGLCDESCGACTFQPDD